MAKRQVQNRTWEICDGFAPGSGKFLYFISKYFHNGVLNIIH